MHRLSMVQALGLWSDLEAAYYGQHGFGGDTAEIYLYRLMSRRPTAEEGERKGGIYGGNYTLAAAYRDLVQDTNEALCSLLRHFAKERGVRIEVNGRELGDWLKTANLEHRVHVKVIH